MPPSTAKPSIGFVRRSSSSVSSSKLAGACFTPAKFGMRGELEDARRRSGAGRCGPRCCRATTGTGLASATAR